MRASGQLAVLYSEQPFKQGYNGNPDGLSGVNTTCTLTEQSQRVALPSGRSAPACPEQHVYSGRLERQLALNRRPLSAGHTVPPVAQVSRKIARARACRCTRAWRRAAARARESLRAAGAARPDKSVPWCADTRHLRQGHQCRSAARDPRATTAARTSDPPWYRAYRRARHPSEHTPSRG